VAGLGQDLVGHGRWPEIPAAVELLTGDINLLGEYDLSDEKLQDSVGIQPPKSLAFPTS
jgi:hypothetical protein